MSAAIAAHRFTLAASPCDVLTLRLERARKSRAFPLADYGRARTATRFRRTRSLPRASCRRGSRSDRQHQRQHLAARREQHGVRGCLGARGVDADHAWYPSWEYAAVAGWRRGADEYDAPVQTDFDQPRQQWIVGPVRLRLTISMRASIAAASALASVSVLQTARASSRGSGQHARIA